MYDNLYSIISIAIGGLLGVFTDLYIIGKLNEKRPRITAVNVLLILFTALKFLSFDQGLRTFWFINKKFKTTHSYITK